MAVSLHNTSVYAVVIILTAPPSRTLRSTMYVIIHLSLLLAQANNTSLHTTSTSKATFLMVSNNNDNFSIDVLYFVRENLKKLQEPCWNFRIFAKKQVSER